VYFSAGLGRGRAAAGAAAAERLRRRWQPACPGLTSAPSPLGAGRNAVWIEIFTSVTSNRVDPCLIDKNIIKDENDNIIHKMLALYKTIDEYTEQKI
jgi:hypothetical protein